MNLGDTAVNDPRPGPAGPAGLYTLILVTVFLGAWQLARGGIRSTGWLVGIVAFCFVAAFLIWATKEKSFNLVGMLSGTLGRAIPIALAALCGVISERAAVVNIAIEGIMLIAAMTAVVSATLAHSLIVGLIVRDPDRRRCWQPSMPCWSSASRWIRSSAAWPSTSLAAGITSFISSRYLESNIDLLNNSGTFKIIAIPLLSKIPILGPILFENARLSTSR